MTQSIALGNNLVNNISIINTKRVKKHLSHVLGRLESANTSNFTEIQISARSKTLEYLRQYIELGEFPVNEHSVNRHAIFRDAYGTYCAVGYLMHRSGFDNLVDEITENNNLVYINEIVDSKYLNAIAVMGISIEEAAMIQPSYGYDPYYNQAVADNDYVGFLIVIFSVLFYLFLLYFAFLLICRLDKPHKDKVLMFFTTLWGASLVGMAILAVIYTP